ncbi:MAG: HEPN/Toprim-associated domain-containing protein [Chloroflexi bacterium]|nr:HEPN/Toprim-associated domain-containing protein [Chloroflexota bacterium]
MSKYPTLDVGSFGFETMFGELHPAIMMLFRPSDLHIKQLDNREKTPLLNYVREDDLDFYDANNPLICVEYRCSAKVARDRLDLKGFTVRAAELVFKEEMVREIREDEERKQKARALSEYFDKRLDVMRSLTFEAWLAAIERIREENIGWMTLRDMSSNDPQLPTLRYILSGPGEHYGFPGIDPRHFVRLVTDKAPPTDEVVYDLTPLVARGYFEDGEDVAIEAEYLMQQDFLLEHRVIVLTEGKSDMEFLQRSLKILYPHLIDYFHFFDFTQESTEGGASQLVKLVRAFASADVRHRILALCDNDTAAKETLSSLALDKLPENIVVAHYPSLTLGESYPTIGPSGEVKMDINGLAGSLEIYLGRDVLEDEEEHLTPVQWKGYSQKMNAYQGEVLNKRSIQEKFIQKLRDCEDHPETVESYDWQGMREIIATMRCAFHQLDLESILSGTA